MTNIPMTKISPPNHSSSHWGKGKGDFQFGYLDIGKFEIICNLEFGYWNLIS
jgi:hypothetical protein